MNALGGALGILVIMQSWKPPPRMLHHIQFLFDKLDIKKWTSDEGKSVLLTNRASPLETVIQEEWGRSSRQRNQWIITNLSWDVSQNGDHLLKTGRQCEHTWTSQAHRLHTFNVTRVSAWIHLTLSSSQPTVYSECTYTHTSLLHLHLTTYI